MIYTIDFMMYMLLKGMWFDGEDIKFISERLLNLLYC